MSKTTPGPWAVCVDPPNDVWYAGITVFCQPQHTRVADVCVLAPEYRANAVLIAESPTMLDLLRDIAAADVFRPDSDFGRRIADIIAKVEG